MTTTMTPAAVALPGTCRSMSRPARSAMAGSRLIKVPKAAVVSRRRARNSRLKGSTGCSAASASVATSSGQVTVPSPEDPAASIETMPATGMETASPFKPVTRSPTRWVRRM
jgi:hypothetical protein